MRKFWVILQREYAQLVHKKSFLFLTLLTPVVMVAFMFLPAYLMQKGTTATEKYAVIDQDGNGLGRQFTDGMAGYRLSDSTTTAFHLDTLEEIPIRETARFQTAYDSLVQAIRDRRLTYLFVIRPDAYLADSNMLLVTNSDNVRDINRFEYQIGQVLSRHRVEVSRINIPIDSIMALTRSVDLPRQDTKGESISPEIKFMVGTILMMLIYMLILINGQAMMQTVIDEKSARIMEVLVSSATPFQIMAGKILGTGLAALTQVAIWIAGGAALAAYASSTGTQLDTSITRTVFNPATVICFAAFLILGYLLFTTIFAFIGSLVNSPKEAQPLLMPVIFVLFVPSMMIGFAVLENPDAGWIRVMSFVPTYTPLVMMMRVAVLAPTYEGNALLSPIMLEAVIGMIGIIIALLIAVWITAKVFRVGILMYGKRPTLPEIMRWIRHS
jgi:ABC-2 type transport system permease protein